MNYLDLKTEVQNLVDPSAASTALVAMIPDLVNEAVRAIVNEPGIIAPALKAIVSVNTEVDQSYTSLPTATDTYEGKLMFASVGGVKVDCMNTLEDLLDAYPDLDEEGDVEAIALEGQTVWYVKQPTTATAMSLLLYKNPTTLSENTDEPAAIPVELRRKTILPYCAAILFDYIEQEESGEQPNKRAQEYAYQQGIIKLREYFAAKRRGMTRSIWNI